MITLGEGLHYDVPMDVYHGNCAPGPSVSGSVLFDLHSSCPAKAIARHYLSPWPREDDGTKATALGTAAHTFLLEGPEIFAERYVVKPEGFDGRTREGKAWLADNAGREAVSAKEFTMISAMRQSVEGHPIARNAFREGKPEVTAIVQDKETGIWLKTRPDFHRKGLAVNLKTAVDASEDAWTRQAANLGYHVSAALSIDVFKALSMPSKYAFVVIEKAVPFLVAVRVLDDAFIEAGRMIYRRALQRFADCLARKEWDGYGNEVSTITIPPWLDRKLMGFGAPL